MQMAKTIQYIFSVKMLWDKATQLPSDQRELGSLGSQTVLPYKIAKNVNFSKLLYKFANTPKNFNPRLYKYTCQKQGVTKINVSVKILRDKATQLPSDQREFGTLGPWTCATFQNCQRYQFFKATLHICRYSQKFELLNI